MLEPQRPCGHSRARPMLATHCTMREPPGQDVPHASRRADHGNQKNQMSAGCSQLAPQRLAQALQRRRCALRSSHPASAAPPDRDQRAAEAQRLPLTYL